MENTEFIDNLIYRFELQDALEGGNGVEYLECEWYWYRIVYSSWEEAAGQETHDHPGGAGHNAGVQDQPLPACAEDQAWESQDGRHAQVKDFSQTRKNRISPQTYPRGKNEK